MSDTKPTAAAMRAARRIYIEAGKIRRVEDMANVIDRETGLPELIAACKAACEAASDCLPISGESPRVDVLYYKTKLMAIDAAAAKCSTAILKAEGT